MNIVRNPAIHVEALSWRAIAGAAEGGLMSRRILPNVSFAIDWWRGAGDPGSFQVTNVAIHALNAMLVFALFALALRRIGGHSERRMLGTAFLAAALWAVHPIQVQAVTYVVQRMAELAALFSVAAVLCYLMAREARGARKVFWFGLTLASLAAGAVSKENAWIAPLLLLCAEYTLCRQGMPLIRRPLDRALLIAPVLLLAAVAVLVFLRDNPVAAFVLSGYEGRDFSPLERLLTQPRIVVFHLSQLIWPLPDRFSIEHELTISTSLFRPWTTLPAILLLASALAAAVLMALRPARRGLAFFALWPFLTLLIESSVVPLELIYEHRMYLPSIGLLGLLALAIASIRAIAVYRAAIAAVAVFLVLSLAATLARVPDWRDEVTLYQTALRSAPGSARVWNNLGTGLARQGRGAEAVRAFDRAIKLDQRNANAWANRAEAFVGLQRYAEAVADYTRAIELRPEVDSLWWSRGLAYAAMGEYQGAVTDLSEVLARDPVDANAFNNRGFALVGLGRYRDALADFDAAITIAPDEARFRVNRADVLYRLGQAAEAVEELRRASALSPGDSGILYNLGMVLRSIGRAPEARDALRGACADGMRPACAALRD